MKERMVGYKAIRRRLPVPCPDCYATGRIGNKYTCANCNGTGEVERFLVELVHVDEKPESLCKGCT